MVGIKQNGILGRLLWDSWLVFVGISYRIASCRST